MFRGKNAFFLATIVLDYLIAIPYGLYNCYLTYNSSFKWIPHLIFLGFFFVKILWSLSHSKIDFKFLKNPVLCNWNTKLPELKKLAEKIFIFEKNNLSSSELYIISVLLLLPTIFGTLIKLSNSGKNLPWFLFPSISLAFFIILFFAAYWPAWKLFTATKIINNPKPYSYCFSYVGNYERLKHYYKRETAEVRKYSLSVSILLFVISIALVIDILTGSQVLLAWINQNRISKDGADLAFKFFEFLGFYILSKEWLKYFYVDEIYEEIKKMPTP